MERIGGQYGSGSEDSERAEIRKIISSEIRRSLQALMPSMIEQIKEEMTQIIDERIMIALQTVRGSGQEIQKRKQEQVVNVPNKRLKNVEEKEGNRESDHNCINCGKLHTGECRTKIKTCYKCGVKGHISRDCKDGSVWCFKCHQVGHIKLNCPELDNKMLHPKEESSSP